LARYRRARFWVAVPFSGGVHGKVGDRGPEVREDGLGIDLGNGVARGFADRRVVELQLAVAQVERHAAEGLDQLEVVEGTEETGLGDHRLAQAHGLGVLDDTAGGVDVGEGLPHRLSLREVLAFRCRRRTGRRP
jgi:hypothetical protein